MVQALVGFVIVLSRAVSLFLISVCVSGLDRSVFFPSTVLRLSTNAGQWKEAASKVTHALVNIR